MKKRRACPPITLRNAQRKLPVDVRTFAPFAEAALEESLRTTARTNFKLSGIEEINVVLVSDKRIAALHQRFMGIAGPTDVITFQHGEIVVSVETAARQALDHQTSFGAELRLYIVHGILHLLGYDDKTESGAKLMAKTQKRIVAASNGRA